jgi:hypothetical protein
MKRSITPTSVERVMREKIFVSTTSQSVSLMATDIHRIFGIANRIARLAAQYHPPSGYAACGISVAVDTIQNKEIIMMRKKNVIATAPAVRSSRQNVLSSRQFTFEADVGRTGTAI